MKSEKRDEYYDIDLNLKTELCDLDFILMIKDLKQRKMFLDSDVDQCSAGSIAKHILQINKEDKDIPVEERTPILLYIASNGGEVDAGFEVIDAITNSKTPVYTINLGYEYSMGFLIGLAGHKRYAMPNAKFLLHDGSNFVYNSGAKAHDQMIFNSQIEQRIKQYVLTRSTVSEETYNAKFRVEWYMFADEAKENGFVDYIIGKDCNLDEII